MLSRLLLHPIPNDNESIFSYLIRLSDENQCKLIHLYNLFEISTTLIKSQNVVNYLSEKSIKLITEATGFDETSINEMTIHKYKPWENDFLSFEIIGEVNKYCPICLKENKYGRLHWNLIHVKICLEHNALLLKTCPQCDNFISLEDINNAKCSRCNQSLYDAAPIYCNDEHIINNQRNLYRAFNIKFTNQKPEYSFPFNLSKKNYIELIIFLTALIEPSYKLLNKLILNNSFYSNTPELMCLIYIEQILNNWPNDFFLLLDDLHQVSHINERINNTSYSISYDEYRNFFFNPIGGIYFDKWPQKRLFESIIIKLDFIHQEFINYFLRNFNNEFFTVRIGHCFGNKKTDIIKSVFSFNNATIGLLSSDNAVSSCTIDGAVRLYNEIFSRSEFIQDTTGYECMSSLLTNFQYFNITVFDIINLILEGKLDSKIFPYLEFGLHAIYFPKVQTKLILLELAKEKLHKELEGKA